MLKYVISLSVAVVMAATVFVAFTPQSVAQAPVCEEYMANSTVCVCATKWFKFLRLVECQVNCDWECTDTYYECTFEDPCKRGETFLQLQEANSMKKGLEDCEIDVCHCVE